MFFVDVALTKSGTVDVIFAKEKEVVDGVMDCEYFDCDERMQRFGDDGAKFNRQ